jgi:hypothetical protein
MHFVFFSFKQFMFLVLTGEVQNKSVWYRFLWFRGHRLRGIYRKISLDPSKAENHLYFVALRLNAGHGLLILEVF